MTNRTPESPRSTTPATAGIDQRSTEGSAGLQPAFSADCGARRAAAAARQSRRARRRVSAAALAISTLLGIAIYSAVNGQTNASDQPTPIQSAPARPASPAARGGTAVAQAQPAASPAVPPAVQPSGQSATPPATPPSATEPGAGATGTTNPIIYGATNPADLSTTAPTTLPSKFIFRFKNASIDTVLEHLSKVAGFIIVEDVPVDGRITIMAVDPVTSSQAVALLDSVLKTSGNTAIQNGRVLHITSRAKAMTMALPVHEGQKPEEIPETDEVITWVIPLKAVDAVKLKTDLAPLISPDATITSNAASNSLIVTDTAANIRRLVQVIHDLDEVPTESSDIRVITLKYADATTTAKLLTDILAPPQQSGQMSQQQAMRMMFMRGRGGPGGAAGASDEESGRTGKLVTSADPRTNTLVIAGPADTVKVAEDIVKTLDADNTEQVSFFSYELKNGQAIDLQSVINSLFGAATGSAAPSSSVNNGFGSNTTQIGTLTSSGSRSGIGSGGGALGSSGTAGVNSAIFQQPRTSGTSGAGAATPGMQTAAQQLLGQAYVVANVDTNSLLVVCTKKYEDRVRKLIETLDRPVAQVLIKCLIAEVTHTNADNVGVQYSILNQRANGNGFTVGSNFGLQGVSATGGLVGSVVEGDFNLVLQAMASTDKLDVLSRPYILATDNQLSSIIVGQDVPIITNVSFTDAGQEINSVQYQQIGIIVNVTPHINPEGLVIMDVAPQVTEIDSQSVTLSPGVSSPIFDTRALQARVGIRDGQTIVIGGLMQDQNTTTVQKIPILGDIPGLGALFRNTSVTKTKTELLVFLTPHVALKPDYLQAMTQKEMKTMMLTPTAVQPGAFENQLRAMEIGSTQPTTQPLLLPSQMPLPRTPGTIIGASPRLPGTPALAPAASPTTPPAPVNPEK